jgi:hypothetical protein
VGKHFAVFNYCKPSIQDKVPGLCTTLNTDTSEANAIFIPHTNGTSTIEKKCIVFD